MKLIRQFLCILLNLTFAATIVGCQPERAAKYQSIISDVTNNEINIETEQSHWTGEYFGKESMRSLSRAVQCNNQQLTGTYVKSINEKLNSYTTDIYRDNNGIEFGLHAETGALVYVNLMNKYFFENEPYLDEVVNPEETAITLAKKIAKEYISGIDEYELIIEAPTVRYKEKDGQTYRIAYHVITFAKKINDYYTSDYISIKITSKGNLASIKMGDIGVFENTIIEFDPILVKNSIDKKVADTFVESSYDLLDSSIADQKIIMTPDGQICLYSDVSICVAKTSDAPIGAGITILTTIGEMDNS